MEIFAGRYRLLRHLGEGGMGSAHLALDLSTHAECVLKRLGARAREIAPESLRHEFELLSRVRHPAVVAVHELGFAPDGAPFFTMEFVPGAPADRARARWDFASLCSVAAEVANGLEALHAAGVLHGDLKPSNLLVLPGRDPDAPPAGVRLVDFGLGALLGRDREGHRGTPGFAAPEVVRGEPLTVASDLYGLGALLYALATGRAAFGPGGGVTALRRQQSAPPPAAALEEAGVPDPLVQLVLRLMAPAPEDRPGDAREVRLELERMHPAARRTLEERLGTERVVGRERELARIERLIGGDRAGGPVVVTGESGVGKSALLTELAVRAALAGRPVVSLAAPTVPSPGALARPLLRRLAGEAGAAAGSERVRALLDDEGASWDESACAALADAAAAWGRAVRERGSAALVLLDDCERMDALSRALLRRIVLHPGGTALSWVCAGRGGFGPGEEDAGWIEAGHGARLELAALDREGAARLLAARLHQAVPARLTELLHRRSGGHPGLLLELTRAAAAAGAIEESESGLVVNAEALEALELPPDFERSRLRRLAALEPAARAAAAALAAWGRPATAGEALALAPGADERALGALVGAELCVRDGAGRFALLPPDLGRGILEALPGRERAALHRALLERPGLSAAERFTHLRDAGETAAALDAAAEAHEAGADESLALAAAALASASGAADAPRWQLRAGRKLMAGGRHRAAISHLEAALEGSLPASERPLAWLSLAGALLRAGRPEDVAEAVARALAESPPAAIRAQLVDNDAFQLHGRGRLDEARIVAERALALAEGSGDDDAVAIAAMTLSSCLTGLGRIAQAEQLAVRACEASERAGSRLSLARALGHRASVALAAGDLARAESFFARSLALAREHGLRLALEEVLLNRAVMAMAAGRWREAAADYDETARIALEDGRPRTAAVAFASLAQLDALSGRPVRARRRARAAIRLSRAYLPRALPYAWRSLAIAFRVAGRVRDADHAMRRALSLATPLQDVGGLDWYRHELGTLRAHEGEWEEADRIWAASQDGEREPDSEGAIMVALARGRAAVRRGEREAAARWLERTTRALERLGTPYLRAHELLLHAERALADERAEDGESLARRALAAFHKLGDTPDAAMAALELARVAVRTPLVSRQAVGEWLQLAAAGFERLGDHRRRERALALAVEWLRRTRAAAPVRERERDLLQAVARLLDSLSDLHELTRRAMQMAVDHLDAERGVLLLADETTGAIAPVVELGGIDAATRDQAVTYSRRVVERVATSGGPLLIGDAPTDPAALSESMVDLRLRSIVCVPLYVAGKVVGAVYLDDSRRPDAFRDADRALLEGFTHLIAVAIEKSRGEEEVRRANEQLVGENLSLRREASVRFQPQNFIGTSSAMQRVRALAERAAQITSTVLLTGEMGTGKEVVARILHFSGRRRQGPFVMVNCGAFTATLLESELFGILPDVATGVRGRDGCFVQANGGTLFLDEIGDMPLSQQVALLNVLANHEVTPVGGGRPRAVDVRIIAATNRDLPRLIEEGKFREDLYYRLAVIPIELPPLRDHKADIPALAQSFASFFALKEDRPVPELSPEFLAVLMQSDWPGNVRELQNYVERVMALTPGRVLRPTQLPRDLEARRRRTHVARGRRLRDVVSEIERQLVREALEHAQGNQSMAARELGMTEQSLRYRLRKYAGESRRYRRVRKNRR